MMLEVSHNRKNPFEGPSFPTPAGTILMKRQEWSKETNKQGFGDLSFHVLSVRSFKLIANTRKIISRLD